MAVSSTDPIDLVLYNAKIITVDDRDSHAEAVAIKNGKILSVGTSVQIRKMAGDHTDSIDLEGKTVLPGFIDAHVHIDCTATHTKLAESFHIPPVKYIKTRGAVRNGDKILETIRQRVHQTPKGQWIIGQGRFSLATDGNSPTKAQLDDIAPDHPVMVRYSAHACLLNSKALEIAGITSEAPSQDDLEKRSPGARVMRDAATGEPTGKVIECGDWIFPMMNPWPYTQLKTAIRDTCFEAASYGVTSIQEFTSWPESTRIYQVLHNSGELPLRVQLCPAIWGLYKTIDLDCLLKLGIQTGFGNEWVKFGRAKIFVDVEGYDENGTWFTWPRINQEMLNQLVLEAHRSGIRVMMHATSRDGQDMAIKAVAAAVKSIPGDQHRARLEHFGGDYWPEGIQRMKTLGMIPVPTPYSSLGWYGDDWLKTHRPGDKTVIYRTLLENGFMPPGNSDSMGTEPEALNPWWSIWCVVARKTRQGQPICPEEGLSVMEAIRVYTRYAAYAGFEENVKGAIEPGKLADLMILDQDPLCVPVEHLPEMQVEATIVGGKFVYRRS